MCAVKWGGGTTFLINTDAASHSVVLVTPAVRVPVAPTPCQNSEHTERRPNIELFVSVTVAIEGGAVNVAAAGVQYC